MWFKLQLINNTIEYCFIWKIERALQKYGIELESIINILLYLHCILSNSLCFVFFSKWFSLFRHSVVWNVMMFISIFILILCGEREIGHQGFWPPTENAKMGQKSFFCVCDYWPNLKQPTFKAPNLAPTKELNSKARKSPSIPPKYRYSYRLNQ